jgi:hypothetical protein
LSSFKKNSSGEETVYPSVAPKFFLGFKGVIGSYIRSWEREEFEDTKWVIGIRKSENDRKHNGHKKKDTRTNNDVQNKHIQTKID